jgi:hypothetical protein
MYKNNRGFLLRNIERGLFVNNINMFVANENKVKVIKDSLRDRQTLA